MGTGKKGHASCAIATSWASLADSENTSNVSYSASMTTPLRLKLENSYQIGSICDQIFKPRGITTDSRSRILTANSDNHCIHIFDQIGQFLCYIDTCSCSLMNPYGLCVNFNDNLYVCDSAKGDVWKIKYTKKKSFS